MTTTPPVPPPGAALPPPAATPSGPRVAIGPAQILGIVGGVLVLISTWLDWIDFGHFDLNFSAYEIPAYILRDNMTDIPAAGINLGVLTFVVAGVCILGALLAPVRWLMLVGGVVAFGIAVDFLWQMNLIADEFEDQGIDAGIFDIAGFAPVIALVGGIVAIVGGAMALRRS